MSAYQRRKGAQWEREVARALVAAGIAAKRGLGQARSATEVADVDVAGWWVEAKCHKQTSPLKALEQAEAATDGRRPVAICKSDRRTPTATFRHSFRGGGHIAVTMDFVDWLTIAAMEGGNDG